MLASAELQRVACAFLIALLAAARGLRNRSLSPSGANAAFAVGFLTWSCSLRFGATLIAFYLSGTHVTRFRAAAKAALEDSHVAPGGHRTAVQVLACSLPATLLAVAYASLFRFDAPVSTLLPMRSVILLAYLLFFAACAGDTFSSELGVVLPSRGSMPVLITAPWRRVPRGTNGGVSWQGTLASGVGGGVMGIVYFLTGPEWTWSQVRLVLVGVGGGVVGSLVDSVVGAVTQASWLDVATGKVLKNIPRDEDGGKFQHICGTDLMSGEMVNAVAAMTTAALAPVALPLFKVAYEGMGW